MAGKYNLSDIELEIMNWIWEHKEGVYFGELMQYFVYIKGKNWKKQSLRTFLIRLIEKGLLVKKKENNNYIYIATKTKDKYIQEWTKTLLSEVYDNSIKNFISALTGGAELDEKDIMELKDFINE